ncbi:MAG TPA: hypothetical protein VEL76_20045 [Gemmataceae bacterium]|nr:hypothetical protein [Gemmataceae bacterium]
MFNSIQSWFTGGELSPTSVWDMVAKVMKKAGNAKIQTLYIHGHGRPGQQGVACSTREDSTGNTSLFLDGRSGKLAGEGAYLSRLAPYFAKNGKLLLGGCKTRRGREGQALVQAVARAVSAGGNIVYAYAGIETQYVPFSGYEGDLICCSPTHTWHFAM